MKKTKFMVAALALSFALPTIAGGQKTPMVTAPAPAKPQTTIDPIDGYVRTTYPAEFKTVRDAVVWLLDETGWNVQFAPELSPRDANSILAQPIDPIAQLPRTMTRLTAIQILIGMNNAIVLDREHRLISFTALGARQ